MRTRPSLLGISLTALFAGSALGCGSGDDNIAPVSSGDAGPDATKTEGGAEAGASPQIKHIFYIMMENHARNEVIGSTTPAPYITSLAAQYGQATQYYGVTHPSLPNYLAAISGDFQGIFDDCKAGPDVTCAPEEFIPADDGGVGAGGDNSGQSPLTPAQAVNAAAIPHWFSGQTLVDQLESNGKTWVAYMDGIAAAGDTSEYWPYATNDAGAIIVDDSGVPTTPLKLYAQKHNPFMYFEGIRTNTNRMAKIVPFTTFAMDMMSPAAKIPNFVWISPNQCNDMHSVTTANAMALGIPGCDVDSTDIAIGDTFVKNTVTAIMGSAAWADGAAIVIVWDEDDYAGTSGCCNSPKGESGYLGGANVPAIVISSLIPASTTGSPVVTSSDPYNHYSLLATIQNLWGFSCLANTCGMKGSQLMTKLFVPVPAADAGAATSEAGASEASSSSDASEASSPPDASDTGTGSEANSTTSPDASDTGTGSEASDAPTGN
jgi:hypothetical protein